jgi:hypothetical protein
MEFNLNPDNLEVYKINIMLPNIIPDYPPFREEHLTKFLLGYFLELIKENQNISVEIIDFNSDIIKASKGCQLIYVPRDHPSVNSRNLSPVLLSSIQILEYDLIFKDLSYFERLFFSIFNINNEKKFLQNTNLPEEIRLAIEKSNNFYSSSLSGEEAYFQMFLKHSGEASAFVFPRRFV